MICKAGFFRQLPPAFISKQGNFVMPLRIEPSVWPETVQEQDEIPDQVHPYDKEFFAYLSRMTARMAANIDEDTGQLANDSVVEIACFYKEFPHGNVKINSLCLLYYKLMVFICEKQRKAVRLKKSHNLSLQY